MCRNTPQAMGKDMLDIFIPHPGVIPGPGGPKNGQKTAKMTWRHIERKNIPGNCLMCHNTPQAMEKDILGTLKPHPGVIPGPGGPKMAKNSQNGQKKQPK